MILSDIGLPGLSGIEGVRLLKAAHPATQILMLTVYGDDDRWVPIDPSIAVFSALPQLEIVRVSGGGHAPTTDREGGGEVLPQYRDALASWLSRTALR